MKYRGVILDFNGVLVWDMPMHAEAWQTVARDLRGREMSEEELSVQMYGRPNAHILSYLAGREVAGEELQRLGEVKESLYRELCLRSPDAFKLSPGARELLDALVAQSIPHTIATSAEKTNLDFFVTQLELGRWFELTKIVYDDGTRPGKPAPDFYLAAARNLGLAPQDCVVVEDAVSGVRAAHAAGIGYIIGIGPLAVHPRLRACEGVATVIENLGQFPRGLLERGAKRAGP